MNTNVTKMLNKEIVLRIVEHMPDEFSLNEFIDRIIVIHRTEKAKKEIESGEGIDWEDLKKEMESW